MNAVAANMRWARQQWTATAHRNPSGMPELSGRMIMCVSWKAGQASMCTDNAKGSMALCHSLGRRSANPGDVLLVVSGSNNKAAEGILSPERCILDIMVVGETVSPWIYHSACLRGIEKDVRADMVYVPKLQNPVGQVKHRKQETATKL